MDLQGATVVAVNAALNGPCGWAMPIVRLPGGEAWLLSLMDERVSLLRSYHNRELSELSDRGAISLLDKPQPLDKQIRLPIGLFASAEFLRTVVHQTSSGWVEVRDEVYIRIDDRSELQKVADGWADTILRDAQREVASLMRSELQDSEWGRILDKVRLIKRFAAGGRCANAYALEGVVLVRSGRADVLPRLHRFDVSKTFPSIEWDDYRDEVKKLTEALILDVPIKPTAVTGETPHDEALSLRATGAVSATRLRRLSLGTALSLSAITLVSLVFLQVGFREGIEHQNRSLAKLRISLNEQGLTTSRSVQGVEAQLGRMAKTIASLDGRTTTLSERTDALRESTSAQLAALKRAQATRSRDDARPLLTEMTLVTDRGPISWSREINSQSPAVRKSLLKGSLPPLYAVLPSETRGESGLISPVGEFVNGPRPEFRWRALTGTERMAALYLVVVRRRDGKTVAKQRVPITSTRSRIQSSLDGAAGVPLVWELVEERKDGTLDESPPRAVFAVLPKETRDRIGKLTAAGRPSLELAVLYARSGRYAEAQVELDRLRPRQIDVRVLASIDRLSAELKSRQAQR